MKRNEMHLIARNLIQNIRIKEGRLKNNYLIILASIPGSGKTTLSQELEKKFNFIKISTDSIKNYLIKIKCDFSLKDLFVIQKEMFKLLMMRNINLISDSNSDLVKYRNRLKEMAKEHSYIPIVIYIKVDLEKAYQRIIKRKKIKKSMKIYKKLIKFKNVLQVPRKAYMLDGNLSKNKFIDEVNKINFE